MNKKDFENTYIISEKRKDYEKLKNDYEMKISELKLLFNNKINEMERIFLEENNDLNNINNKFKEDIKLINNKNLIVLSDNEQLKNNLKFCNNN